MGIYLYGEGAGFFGAALVVWRGIFGWVVVGVLAGDVKTRRRWGGGGIFATALLFVCIEGGVVV